MVPIDSTNYRPETDIDLVITWVDGLHSEWRKRYESYLASEDVRANDQYFNARFNPQQDIQILFRSLARFAPNFFNRIWLVHDSIQSPPIESAQVTLVAHEDFIPASFLPTYSSTVIESYLYRIPGLSERFVYFNDDTFFCSPPDESSFFCDTLPLVFLDSPTSPLRAEDATENRWRYALAKTNRLLNEKFLPFGDPECLYRKYTAHLPKAFTTQMYEKTWELFGRELELLAQHKCRLVAAKYDTVLEPTMLLIPWVGLEFQLARAGSAPWYMLGYRPDDPEHHRYGMGAELFPQKSHFEK